MNNYVRLHKHMIEKKQVYLRPKLAFHLQNNTIMYKVDCTQLKSNQVSGQFLLSATLGSYLCSKTQWAHLTKFVSSIQETVYSYLVATISEVLSAVSLTTFQKRGLKMMAITAIQKLESWKLMCFRSSSIHFRSIWEKQPGENGPWGEKQT